MEENSKTSVKAKLYKRISKPFSDYCIYLCGTTDYSHLPPSFKKSGSKSYITITGYNLPAIESVEIEYFGEWLKNKKYGLQFKADSYSFVQPTTEKGIKAFLKSKAFPGIGPKSAEAIVEYFGKDTLSVIKDAPNKLLTVPGISPSKVGMIISAYKKNESYSNITVFLSQFGVSQDSIVRINDRSGENAVDEIINNPYSIQEVKGIGFKTCDKIARGLNVSLDSFERVRGGILETIRNHISATGDTCIGINDLEEKALFLLNEGIEPTPVSELLFKSVAKVLFQKGEIVVRNKAHVFTKEYDEAEDYSARKLLSFLKTTEDGLLVLAEVNRFKKESKFKLSDRQTEAVIMALSNRVSIITGGAGTGKSTILTAIIECYKRLYNGDIVLLAPTGKAARRMTEVTGYPASTIHSKIGIYDSKSHKEVEKIPKGLIVIDEASMVDMLLLSKLLMAAEEGSHLLFIGDSNQLPSVSSGAVLCDMINSGVIPVTRLTEIFRQKNGSIIAENAGLINSGNESLFYDDDFKLIKATSENDAINAIKDTYSLEVSKYGIDNVALLSPLRRSQNGRFKAVSDELNKVLQDVVNPRKTGKFCILNGQEFREGDRVLQWKNTELSSNGDIGEIKEIFEEEGSIYIKIHWDNGNNSLESRQSMTDITLAYAISIHKSQGSEYKSVIIPILSVQLCQLMKRNLLYTATTRSKERVIYVGDEKAINYCITHCDADKRVTLFSKRLKYYSKK